MKIKKLGALLVSAALCAGMAAPAFAFEGEAAPVEQPVLPEVVEEDVVTVTDETSGALTPEGNLTLVDDYHTDYSDGSGQQFITLVSKSGATFYLVIDRNAKGQQTVHFMNLVDEADLLTLMEEEDADAYTAEKEAAAKAEQDKLKAEEEAKKAAEEAEKPSVAMAYAKVLGATSSQDGYLEGNGYLVSWCVGHLVELAPPNVYDAKYVKWSIADLPILPQKWQYLVSAGTKKQFGILKKLMHRPDVDSIVNSCDVGWCG